MNVCDSVSHASKILEPVWKQLMCELHHDLAIERLPAQQASVSFIAVDKGKSAERLRRKSTGLRDSVL